MIRPYLSALLAFVFVFHPSARAEGLGSLVWFRAPDVQDQALKGFLAALGEGQTSAERGADASPKRIDRLDLERSFDEAQSEFLSGNSERAKQKFEIVALMARSADWTLDERRIIHLSLLRVAQLSSNEEEMRRALTEAIQFDPDQVPRSDLIPPPIVEKYFQLKKSELAAGFDWPISEFSRDFTAIKINGRVFHPSKGGSIRITSGLFRVTLLTNLGEPVTQILSHSQVLALPSRAKSEFSGSCENPAATVHIKNRNRPVGVYYGSDCAYIYTGSEFRRSYLGTKSTRKALVPPPETPSTVDPVSKRLENSLSNKTAVEERKVNPWFLGGLAVVGGVIAYSIWKSQASSGPTKTPTHE